MIRVGSLPSVPAACAVLSEIVVVLFGELEDFSGVDSEINVFVLAFECLRAAEMHFPNLHCGILFQRWIVKTNVNPRAEGWIKCSNTVGSKEQNATIIFECSKEDGHDGIPLDVNLVTFLKEYVSFIQEENTVPLVGQLKAVFQVTFDIGSSVANISTCNREEWSFSIVCNAFGCRSLTNACFTESVRSRR
jgi:hypothetical protein